MPSSKVEAAWAVIEALGRQPGASAIRPLFAADPDRAARMTHRAGDVLLLALVVSGKFGSVIRAIRDDEQRVRFLGYSVEGYKLFVFTLTAVIAAIAGALYYPQAGIINPAELAPIASIYLAVWVAIGGRGRLYGAVIGAAFVSLLSSWFTGGRAPSVPLGFYTIDWVDWWLVILGLSFVAVTLFAPKGIGGLFDLLSGLRAPDRKGAALGPDEGALMEKEARE